MPNIELVHWSPVSTPCCGCGWGCWREWVGPWREWAQLQIIVSRVVVVGVGLALVLLAGPNRLVDTPVQVNQGSHGDDSSDEHSVNRNHATNL